MKNKKGQGHIVNSQIKQISSLDNIKEYKLTNGLKVLTVEDHMAPVVTVMILFKVGSRNEAVGHTGSTHFLEHMLFKGTKKHNPDLGNGIDEILTQIGGHWNATTWFDRTTYYEVVPKEHLKLCLKLEADRMRNLLLRQEDHDSEMTVVRNELERGENYPEDALDKEMYAIAFREHPYHHPTIGWRSDVESVSMEKLRDFYNTYYWPDNACLIIAGDFDNNEALEHTIKYFGKIKASPKSIPDVYTIEPAQEGKRSFEIKRVGDLARVWMGFHVPEAKHKDTYTLGLIKHLLGGSSERASRLYKRLIDTNMACDVFTRHDDLKDPALFIIGAMVNSDVNPKDVEAAILDELDKLANSKVSEAEITSHKIANQKGTILSTAKSSNLAFILAEAESKVDWQWMMNYDDHFDKITDSDILHVAKKYFKPNNQTLGYFTPVTPEELDLIKNEETPLKTSVKESKKTPSKEAKIRGFVPKITPLELKEEIDSVTDFSNRAKIHQFKNGLKLIFLKSPGAKALGIAGAIKAYNPQVLSKNSNIPDMTAELLASGSKNYSKDTIAKILEEMAIPNGLDFSADKFKVNFSTLLVNNDLEKYLELLMDVIRHPKFLEEEIEKSKIEWTNHLNEANHNTRFMANNKFKQLLYPSNHVYYEKSITELIKDLQNISHKDLNQFHKHHYAPNSCIISIVGDLDFDNLIALIEKLTHNWEGEDKTALIVDPVKLPQAIAREFVNIPNKTSSDIILGHTLDLKRTDKDYFALRVGNTALGGDTITARLGHVVRVKAGLTYGIYSGISNVYLGSGSWTVNLSVNPKNVDKSIDLTYQVLRDFIDKGITKSELAKEIRKAAGSFKVGLASPSAIASVMCELEFYGLGIAELDKIVAQYQSLTVKEVNAAIKKHLHPDKSILVTAGSVG